MNVALGNSGISVSPITFGTWQLSGHWGEFDEEEAVRAVRRAYELGVTSFDTAHAYGWGRAERVLGDALRDVLRDHREAVVIVTKGGLKISEQGRPFPCSEPGFLRMGLENSLRSLGVEQVDLYLVHAPDPQVPFADTAEFLREQLDKGAVAHVGVSNFSPEQAAELGAMVPIEVFESRYHIFRREIEQTVLPYAEKNDLGVLAYSPLANGLLSGAVHAGTTFPEGDWRRYAPHFQPDALTPIATLVGRLSELARDRFGVPVAQLAMAWSLHHPAVHSVISGTRRAEHVEAAVAATELRLGPDDLAAIDRVLDSNEPA